MCCGDTYGEQGRKRDAAASQVRGWDSLCLDGFKQRPSVLKPRCVPQQRPSVLRIGVVGRAPETGKELVF